MQIDVFLRHPATVAAETDSQESITSSQQPASLPSLTSLASQQVISGPREVDSGLSTLDIEIERERDRQRQRDREVGLFLHTR